MGSQGYRDLGTPAAAELQPGPSGRHLVAVIGIDAYRSWPRLHNAVSDARGVMALFSTLGFELAAPPLIDEAATGKALRRLVTDDLTRLGPEDSLVLFFAGHGFTREHTFQHQVVRTGYIIPTNGHPLDGYAETWIRLDAWLSDVARLPAKHILVILDACHSGIALDTVLKWRHDGAADPLPHAALQARRSRRVITSALVNERALDTGPLRGHSLFTGCLIEALTGGLARDGKRDATGSELALYIQRRVATYPGASQTPDFGTLELDDRGEIMLPLLDRVQEQTGPTSPPVIDPGVTPRIELSAPIEPVKPAPASEILTIDDYDGYERTLAVRSRR